MAYTVDGNNITFVAANAMRTVALGEGTYTKVEDAYKGTYTLPDNAGTIMTALAEQATARRTL